MKISPDLVILPLNIMIFVDLLYYICYDMQRRLSILSVQREGV